MVARITANARVAAVEWRMAGTFSAGPSRASSPTAGASSIRGCDCLEIKDGKIVRNTAYYDGMQFARAVGMLPAAGLGRRAGDVPGLQRGHEGAPGGAGAPLA